MNEKFQKLIEKLNADEQFTEKLLALETPEEAQSLLKGIGFEFTIAEIMELRDEFTKAIETNENGELSDEALEGVAGGTVQGALDGLVDNSNNIIQNHLGGKQITLPPLQHIRLPRIRRPRRW